VLDGFLDKRTKLTIAIIPPTFIHMNFFSHYIFVYFFYNKDTLTMNHVHLMQCKKKFKYKVDKTTKDKNQVVFVFV